MEGLIFGGAYLRREILRFKTDWVSLIVGSKFTAFALFSFVLEGNFPSTSPRGLYLEGRFNGGFFALPVWGAYIWRGLFSEFYGIINTANTKRGRMDKLKEDCNGLQLWILKTC